MSAQENIEKTRRLFVEVFTGGHMEACDDLLTSGVQLHDPRTPEFPGGVQAFKEWEGMYQQAFPHKKLRIDEIFDAGEKVVVRWTAIGKHEGEFNNIPATGKDMSVSGISIFEFSDGKIKDMWNNWDSLGLYQQLGVDHISQ